MLCLLPMLRRWTTSEPPLPRLTGFVGLMRRAAWVPAPAAGSLRGSPIGTCFVAASFCQVRLALRALKSLLLFCPGLLGFPKPCGGSLLRCPGMERLALRRFTAPSRPPRQSPIRPTPPHPAPAPCPAAQMLLAYCLPCWVALLWELESRHAFLAQRLRRRWRRQQQRERERGRRLPGAEAERRLE